MLPLISILMDVAVDGVWFFSSLDHTALFSKIPPGGWVTILCSASVLLYNTLDVSTSCMFFCAFVGGFIDFLEGFFFCYQVGKEIGVHRVFPIRW